MTRRTRQDVTPHNHLDYPIVVVSGLPVQFTTRRLRKLVGRATYNIQRQPRILFAVRVLFSRPGSGLEHGKTAYITFGKKDDVQTWLNVYGGRFPRKELELNGCRLSFTYGMESTSKFHLRAIRYPDNNMIDSDYDEKGADDAAGDGFALPIRSVECGSFDDDDLFCVGWSKQARSAASAVTFDVDAARLSIRVEHNVIEAKLFQIGAIFVNKSAKNARVYFAFKQAPTFLRDSVPGTVADAEQWLDSDQFDFACRYDNFDRLPVFDHAHRRCAQFAAVYRVEVYKVPDIERFFKGTSGRLHYSGNIKALGDSQADAFDVESLTKKLQNLSFPLAYQAEALMGPHKLMPKDIIALVPDLRLLEHRIGVENAAFAVRDLRQMPVARGPFAIAKGKRTTSMQKMREHLTEYRVNGALATLHAKRNTTLIHTVTLTPCFGVRAEGPHPDEGNRILRRYAGFESNFVRARIADEDGSAVRMRPDGPCIDAEVMVTMRYGDALKGNGIVIGGRKFQFLAYGNSGLREGTCWFVRKFTLDGRRVTAEDIRTDIGELSSLKNAARYAARMGQAFSASSISITLNACNVHVVEDVATPCGKYEFTDGVGMVSKQVLDRVNEVLSARKAANSLLTAFQIRLGGAKGMLALNPELSGEQVILRKSMVKFQVPPRDGKMTMEVSGYFVKPLPVFLNRQLITLLESLGVPKESFLDLQRNAVEELRMATLEPRQAVTLHNHNGLGRAANINALITRLQALNINAVRSVPFLHDVNISFINFALRRVKYAARIAVPDCHTLVGIVDETGLLEPNEIVAPLRFQDEKIRYIKGPCLVTRSPAIAPGDVQRAVAVEPPVHHPLRAQHNVCIFSKKGVRPLPSCLSGGDLDGDLYNILQHPSLEVKFTTSPQSYERPELSTMQRSCNIDDVADFLLDYIRLDKLGIVSSRHLHLADQLDEGSLSEDCIKLAEMHSVAVDFAKTGLVPDQRQLPKARTADRPDFMQREYYLEDMRNDFGTATKRVSSHPRTQERFYPSNKALGLMFRSIDVYAQANEWAKAAELYAAAAADDDDDDSDSEEAVERRTLNLDSWAQRLWQALTAHGRAFDWQSHLSLMKVRVQLYYRTLKVIAKEHCVEDSMACLAEEEVFMGHILCRGPHGSRLSPFDTSKALQDSFEELCKSTRSFVLLKRDLWDNDVDEGGNVKYTVKYVVWRWLNYDLNNDLTPERLDDEMDRLRLFHSSERRMALGQWEDQLLYATQRGVAWVKASFEEKIGGRSAPWIMVPSVLKAQQSLDAIARYRHEVGM